MTDIGTLPGSKNSKATGINLRGQVVGISWNTSADARAFLWQNGSMYDLGLAYDGDAPRINDSSQVVFTAIDSNGKRQAVIYQNAQQKALSVLTGDDNSGATGINGKGDAVGYSFKTGSAPRPVLFRDGAVIALNSSLATSGWTLVNVTGINDTGRIVGQALGNGVNQAVLLTPH
jgi:probable HAF family extracellular repeat protein